MYHAGMAPDTITLPRPPTPAACLEPSITEQPAAAVTSVLVAPTAAESESAAPPNPQQPPDLDLLGDRIAELSARIQAATYELLCYLREFDRQHGWEGFRSCAHWLNWRTGLDLGAAREKLRVAAALADLNHLSAAMACGRLSYSIVRALTRVATPATEARLVAVACCATGAQVERLVRGWRQADCEAQPDAEQVRLARRTLSTRVDDDGMLVLRARLTPEVGAVVLRAVEAALEQVPPAAEGDEASSAQRRADCVGAGGRERAGRRARSRQPRRPLPGDRARGSGDPWLPRDRSCHAGDFRGNARDRTAGLGTCGTGDGRRCGPGADRALGRSPPPRGSARRRRSGRGTRPRRRAGGHRAGALADLAEAKRKLTDPATPQTDHKAAQDALPELLRAAREALELHADPNPPELEAVDLLTDPDPATLYAALDAPDPPGAAQYLTDLALRSGAQTAGRRRCAAYTPAPRVRRAAATADIDPLAGGSRAPCAGFALSALLPCPGPADPQVGMPARERPCCASRPE